MTSTTQDIQTWYAEAAPLFASFKDMLIKVIETKDLELLEKCHDINDELHDSYTQILFKLDDELYIEECKLKGITVEYDDDGSIKPPEVEKKPKKQPQKKLNEDGTPVVKKVGRPAKINITVGDEKEKKVRKPREKKKIDAVSLP